MWFRNVNVDAEKEEIFNSGLFDLFGNFQAVPCAGCTFSLFVTQGRLQSKDFGVEGGRRGLNDPPHPHLVSSLSFFPSPLFLFLSQLFFFEFMISCIPSFYVYAFSFCNPPMISFHDFLNSTSALARDLVHFYRKVFLTLKHLSSIWHATSAWKLSPNFYGNGESFVFSFETKEL